MKLNHDDYLKLIKKLNQLNKDYYTKNQSQTTDTQYDQWYQQIKTYEENNPLLVSTESPTKNVGTSPEKKFSHHTHKTQMLSLNNAFNDHDITQFLTRIEKDTKKISYPLSIEPKIDGCAVSITYKNGDLNVAATRRRWTNWRDHY